MYGSKIFGPARLAWLIGLWVCKVKYCGPSAWNAKAHFRINFLFFWALLHWQQVKKRTYWSQFSNDVSFWSGYRAYRHAPMKHCFAAKWLFSKWWYSNTSSTLHRDSQTQLPFTLHTHNNGGFKRNIPQPIHPYLTPQPSTTILLQRILF